MSATRAFLSEGSTVVLPHPPLDEGKRARFMQRIVERASDSASRRRDLAVALKNAMSRFDPITVIGELAREAHTGHPDEPDMATSLVSVDAKLEHLLGLALGLDPVPTRTPPIEATREVQRLVDALFEAESDRIVLETIRRPQAHAAGLDPARLLLRLEYLMDRMEGYTPHLAVIQRAVFEPLHDRFLSALGFCPADVTPLVGAYVTRMNVDHAAVGDFMDVMEGLMSRYPIDGGEYPSQQEQQRVLEGLESATSAWRMAYVWEPRVVAEASGIPSDQVDRMLWHLSVPWGCQPHYLLPDDSNVARLRPAVRLDAGDYFVPLGWNFVHGLFPWIADVLRSSGHEELLRAVQRRRQKAAETVTRDALGRIYGDFAMGPLHYEDAEDGAGEIDAFVATGDVPIVVECKAHSLTAAGRRGLPRRVERVRDDVMGEGLAQLARARDCLMRGRREFADREGEPPTVRLSVRARDTVHLLVTFERMDPLIATGVERLTPAWFVCLADLLLVVDLLPSPAEFFDYASLRAGLQEKGVTVYVEADALALYLEDRLRGAPSGIGRRQGALGLLGRTDQPFLHFHAARRRRDAPRDEGPIGCPGCSSELSRVRSRIMEQTRLGGHAPGPGNVAKMGQATTAEGRREESRLPVRRSAPSRHRLPAVRRGSKDESLGSPDPDPSGRARMSSPRAPSARPSQSGAGRRGRWTRDGQSQTSGLQN